MSGTRSCVLGLAALLASAGVAQAQFSASPSFNGRGPGGGSADANEYTLDDGTGENNIGLGGVASSIAWLNRFSVTGGLSTITDIRIAFGVNNPAVGGTPMNGAALTVYLWSDPNGDGNPNDAAVLTSLGGVVANSGTDTFNVFDIADTNVGANGTNFFVGAIITQTGLLGTSPGSFPCRIDQTDPDNVRSYIAGNTSATPVNPASLGVGNTINVATIDSLNATLAGDWMIRASAIPAPGSLALLGLGGLVLTRRRR